MLRLFESGVFVLVVYIVVSIAAILGSARASSHQDLDTLLEIRAKPLHLI